MLAYLFDAFPIIPCHTALPFITG